MYKGLPSYRRSFQSSKENIQHFYFCGSFLSRIRILTHNTGFKPVVVTPSDE